MGSNLDTHSWDRVCGQLRDEVGDAAFRSWLKPLALGPVDDDSLSIRVPTRFMRDWVQTHYGERIRALLRGENPAIRSVTFIVDSARAPANDSPAAAPHGSPAAAPHGGDGRRQAPPGDRVAEMPAELAPPATRPTVARAVSESIRLDEREALSAPLDPRYTFDNFVVGKPNEFAYAAAKRVAESDQVAFNPLFLYGGVGLGKTHLMHAIAWEIRERNPGRTVAYLSAEKFMYRFVRALRSHDTVSFKEQFRSVDILMIDDVQFISGKDSTQEEFFHTFNALVDQGRQIVLSADKSPSDLEGIGERLRSRMGCGLVADIHPTTYELRIGILQSKADQLGVTLPPKVTEFLAHKMTSNARELEGALIRLAAHSQLVGREITLESAQDVLQDLLRAYDRRVTVEEIQKKVAEHFTIKVTDMSSARRARNIARPRQVAMYLAKQLTSQSLPQIGRKFGNRDHTTVMHAVRKVEELIEKDQSFGEDVELLKRMLEN